MRLLLLVTIIALSACHKPDEKPPVSVLETQQKQMQQARDVEQTLQKADEATRKAIDEQSGTPTAK